MTHKKTDRDTTIDDIHRTRERIHDAFHGDLKAMLDDARLRQAASGRPVWSPLEDNSVSVVTDIPAQPQRQLECINAES